MDAQHSALSAGPRRRFPRGKLALLGMAACLAWLGAALADVWVPPGGAIPSWLRQGAHGVLVLAPAGLALVWLRLPAASRPRRAFGFYAVETLVLLLVAFPSLAPYTTASDLLGSPLRVPTVSLGVALAAVDPHLLQRWRDRRESDASLAVAAGVSFALSCVAIGTASLVLLPWLGGVDCPGQGCAWLGAERSVGVFETLASTVTGVLGAWIGYMLGAVVARSARWLPVH